MRALLFTLVVAGCADLTGPETARLYVENATIVPFTHLYLEEDGMNVAAGQPLAPREIRRFTVRPGCRSVRVINAAGWDSEIQVCPSAERPQLVRFE